jgi:hypothetical protein
MLPGQAVTLHQVRSPEQVGDTGAAHDAALRKSDDLCTLARPRCVRRRQHAVQLQKAALEIDVDMGAQMRGAARHARLDQITGAFLGGDRQQGRIVLSVSMRLIRLGPAIFATHGSPIRVLSRCM